MYRQTDRQTNRERDRQTDKGINTETHKQTETERLLMILGIITSLCLSR